MILFYCLFTWVLHELKALRNSSQLEPLFGFCLMQSKYDLSSISQGRADWTRGAAASSPLPLKAFAAAPTARWAMAEPVPNAMPWATVPISPDIMPPPPCCCWAGAGAGAAGRAAGGGGALVDARRAGGGALRDDDEEERPPLQKKKRILKKHTGLKQYQKKVNNKASTTKYTRECNKVSPIFHIWIAYRGILLIKEECKK
jgi:hypothetical protein